jgi:hypothetical protein
MAKLVVIKGDPVKGTDTHNVTGTGDNSAAPPPKAAFAGTGDYKYLGTITDQVSDFVTVNGTPLALVASKSSLNPGETSGGGAHAGPSGANFAQLTTPNVPQPDPDSVQITDGLDPGVPSSGAGSQLLTVGGVKALLDADKLDTCGSNHQTANSSVAAQGQDFVRCGS